MCEPINDYEKVRVPEEYKSWFLLVMKLFHRVATGKGAERHGEKGVPFEKQVWAEILKEDGPGWAFGQVTKKKREAQRFIKNGEMSRAIPEFMDCAVAFLMVAMHYEAEVLDIWQSDKGDKGFVLEEKRG
jgi:hypothetical protein